VKPRLLWFFITIIIAALVLLALARAWSVGKPTNRRIVAIARAGADLGQRFPGHRFRVQVSAPAPGRRDVVLTIQPGKADSAALAVLPDSAADWLVGRLDLSGFDTLYVAMFDSVVRARPLD
jgi:hypothetical protein